MLPQSAEQKMFETLKSTQPEWKDWRERRKKGPGKTTYTVSAHFCYGNDYIWQAILI
jgi:hypothetical protein